MNWRLYWFLRNLSAFILLIPCSLVSYSWGWIKTARIIFITDGSETISYPWEIDWNWNFD